jgi:hypothetical protein
MARSAHRSRCFFRVPLRFVDYGATEYGVVGQFRYRVNQALAPANFSTLKHRFFGCLFC